MFTRRHFTIAAPGLLGSAVVASGCSPELGADGYEAAATQTWRRGPILSNFEGTALSQELVRYATLAPSSHNTQCWKFKIEDQTITVLPDMSRRCPAVDPDDHHLFISMGCATENLVQAALAHGLQAEVRFDPARDATHITLTKVPALATPLFNAMVEVGRCDERFALQATALGVRNAFVNQSAEIAAIRLLFASAIGLAGQRPDLVVRFGRGPTMPQSLRRPVADVLV
jgi:hypothetical protein